MISPESQTIWRVAVIGGGISGLAVAYRLQELCAAAARPLDLTVFESSARVGGVTATQSLDGYRIELGADSFITNKPWAVDLCRRLGIVDRLIQTNARYRRSLVLRNGRPLPVPDGFQLLAPVDVGAVLRSPLFSWRGKLRMALEYLVPRRSGDADESLADFVRRRLGREALERLVQPLVGGIYTSDPERLSLRATMPRFHEMEREHGSLIRALRRQASRSGDQDAKASGARYGLFTTLPNGISELIESLVNSVQKSARIQLATEVTDIVPDQPGSGFTLELADGSRERFDAVVLAVPAYRAADAIARFVPRAADELRRIEYASTAIVVSGHQLADISHPLDAFGLVVPAIEKRKILAVSFTSRKFPDRAPEGCVQLRTFVGGAMQPELMQFTDDELVALVKGELEQIFGVTWKPDFTRIARWQRAMPQYHVGHLDRVAAIEREISAFPQLALAGSAYHGVGLPDSIHSGELAAERLFETDKPITYSLPPRRGEGWGGGGASVS
ncbi:MAG: protoporphyrinogen oxidase [Planctomycetaceae bacterium]|nr:protoporphyrinogen oxidase [Planctomycetaceae bacterium]